ncbi:MAG: sulfatase-like hydrolase/transferase [Planctomycetes bacterium]|nr:sulfatase-like hydrolase/transferase [Planctomycetota bacterium]
MLRVLAVLCLLVGLAIGQRPNVVVILVDDLGWTDLTCQGSGFYETPHIDALAAAGVRFTNGYAAAAICSPTRAAILTGRAPARTHVTDWIRARFQRGGIGTPERSPTDYVGGPARALLCPPNPYWLEREEVTLAELLQDAGYTTCHVGKWHLGDDAWYPEHQGFDENHGGCDFGQPPSYFDPYSDRRLPEGIPTLPPRRDGEYLTDREADEAVDFIARNRYRPFFLYYAPYAVHTPIQARPEVAGRYAAKQTTNQTNARYAAMVESVDQAVGRIVAALEEHALTERTLVVFTSDNGGLIGPTDNAPLRSGKGYPYEGGLRVPWIVRWPGVVEAGRVSEQPVTSVDLLPTVLDAVGIELPAERSFDGVSLVPHLRAGTGIERPLFWHFPHYRGPDVTPYSVVRDGRWKLIVRWEGPALELYDLEDDLGETRDVATAHADVVARLRGELDAHLAGAGALLPRANPDHVAKPRVLILGDSISIGYTPKVRELLADEAVVVRPTDERGRPENCAGTTRGVEHLERWLALGGGHWDVIHFNFGLHDLKRVDAQTGRNSNDPADPRQAEPEIYERQLRQIAERLARTGATLIFATTTPVPPGGVRPHRDVDDPARYNAIARRVMEESGVEIDDLYGLVAPRQAELLPRVDVHFAAAGYEALAQQVAAHVRGALAAR